MVAIPLPQAVPNTPEEGWTASGYKNANALQKQNLENLYYGPLAQADVASKNAYAQWLPAQITGQIIASPAFGSMPSEQQNALLGRYQQSMNGQSPSSMPPPKGSGLLNSLMGYLFPQGSSSQPQNSLMQDQWQSQTQDSQPAVNAIGNNSYSNTKASPDEIDWISRNGNQEPMPLGYKASQTPGQLPPSHVGNVAAGMPGNGINPMTTSAAQGAALTARATGEQGAQTEQQKQMEDDASAAAEGAINQNNLIRKAVDVHHRIPQWQRGIIGGELPALESNRKEIDSTMSQIVASIAQDQGSGNVTNQGRDLAASSKFPITAPDAAFEHLTQYSLGMNNRVAEKPGFISAMNKLNMTPAQIKTLWQYYQSKKPFYDDNTHKQNSDNLNSWDKFYATQDRINSAFSPAAQKEIDKNFTQKEQVNRNVETVSLTGGLIVPKSFDSKDHFQQWYDRQPKATQLAYMQHLQGNQ